MHACLHAEVGFAESGEFPLEVGNLRSVEAVASAEFPVDVRANGGVGSMGSAEFALDTMITGDGWLEVTAPANVASGSVTPLLATWHYGTNSTRTVTSQVRWVFRGAPAGNSYFSGTELRAGVVSVSTPMTFVAIYETVGGFSRESASVTITVLPGLQATITAARQGTTALVTYTASVSGGSGNVTVRWDTDGDGLFDDGIAPAITVDYGTSTGTKTVFARITDGAGGGTHALGGITINKPLVANQPAVTIPAADPAGFDLFNPDAGNSTFAFDPPRKDNGLVVIAHGLHSDAKQPWLREMAEAIESRCPAGGKPNIALMDWSRDAADPAPVSWVMEQVIELMLATLEGFGGSGASISADVGASAVQFAGDLIGVRNLGLMNGQLLANWIYANSRLASPSPINPDAPIHFIGHSAGGFVCGEAARLLKHPRLSTWDPVHIDMVTLLDTPLPPKEHMKEGNGFYPNPGMTERIVSSVYGMPDTWTGKSIPNGLFYNRTTVLKSRNPFHLIDPEENGHGYAYIWYTEESALGRGGFTSSPIINPSTRIPKPYFLPQSAPLPIPGDDDVPQPSPAPPAYPDIVLTDWQTFGNASEVAGTWTLSENADAGIWKDVSLPASATKLAFDFHFLTAGDGDFLAVHFGDYPVIYQGLDLPLSRDAWLPAEIPLDLLPSLEGKLVFTLVSRGGVNAQVQIRNLRIIQSEDPDEDGLTMDQELAIGSNPRSADSDGDGIFDGDEVGLYGTDPMLADTDGDGKSDASELGAGTNPLANGSYFRVTSLTRTPQGGMTLQWTGEAGRTYRVFRSRELGTGNFETLAFYVPAVTPLTTFTDPSPLAGRGFYWIGVE
jgi:hypothetical protein